MSPQDYINLTRAIGSFGWKDTPNMVYFWIRIIFMANTEDTDWHGIMIKRGSFVTTVSGLAEELKLSVKQVRTCIERLKKGKYVGTNTANNKHIITICDFDSYIYDGANEGQMKGKCSANVKNTPSLMSPDSSLSDSPSLTPFIFPQENEKEGETDVSPKKRGKPVSAPSEFDFILKLWNDSARRDVPKIRMLSPARKEKVKLRIKEMGGMESAKGILAECFKKISESDFCNGATGKWTATWDWFFENEKNWMKVLEGNYDNRKEKTQLEILAENIAKADAYYEQRYHGYGGASAYGNQEGGRDYGPDEQ